MISPPSLIAYADLHGDPLIRGLAAHASGVAAATDDVARILFASPVSPVEAVARRVLASTGPFARAAQSGSVDTSRVGRAAGELATLEGLGRLAAAVARDAGLDPDAPAAPPPGDAPAFRTLAAALAAARDWGVHAEAVAAFHAREGVGDVATHRVLRFDAEGARGVEVPDAITPHDLIGDDTRWRPLRDALAAFATGGPAVDALLYGPPGTGKSATVRALAQGQADAGLRLVQVDRAAVARLGELFALVAGDGPRCLVLLDDLVFDEGGRDDRGLRAALEGDVAARPANVVVWATSNRMRLIHETRSDREEDIEGELGRGERAALATRFALRANIPPLDRDAFVAMAGELVRRRGGSVSGVPERALRFARDHGMTARAAQQFAAWDTAVTPTA